MRFSIIIPVYNSGSFLESALNSVVRQTFSDMEIILVDDGSIDGSGEVCERYAAKDDRICVIHQENSGAGPARNTGIEAASGEYIVFVDADDLLLPNALEIIDRYLTKEQDDLLEFGKEEIHCGGIADLPAYSGKIHYRHMTQEQFITKGWVAPWGKAIRREIFSNTNIRFPALAFAEDNNTIPALGIFAEHIGSIDAKLYGYGQHGFGVIGGLNVGKLMQSMRGTDYLLELFRSNGAYNRFRAELEYFVVRSELCSVCCRLIGQGYFPEELSRIREHVRSLFPDYLNNPLINESGLRRAVLENAEGGWDEIYALAEELGVTAVSRTCPSVSVVMPVYNAEPYLEETMNCLLGQSLKSIEIICADDGSTDGSAGILERYADEHTNIRVLHCEHGGAAAARNAGFREACGEYVYFMDADDLIVPAALEKLYTICSGGRLDVLYFAGKAFCDPEEDAEDFSLLKRDYYGKKHDHPFILPGKELFCELRETGDYYMSLPMQMIRREFLARENIALYEGIIYEDNLFSLSVILHARRAACIRDELFFRRVHHGSVMTTAESSRNVFSLFRCLTEMSGLADRISLNAVQRRYVSGVMLDMYDNCVRIYNRIPQEEQRAFLDLCSARERLLFEALVQSKSRAAREARKQKERAVRSAGEENAGLKDEILRLKKEIDRVKKEEEKARARVKELEGSESFRLGRALLRGPRAVKQRFQRKRDE